MIKFSLATAGLLSILAVPALAQTAQPAAPSGDLSPTSSAQKVTEAANPTTLTTVPDGIMRGETAPVITVPGIAVGTVTLEPGPGGTDSVSVGTAMDAAVKSGFLGQILSGRPYTIFVPSNAALAAVPQDALAAVTDDPDRMTEVLQGYVIEGKVDTGAALAMAREAGGQVTVDSLDGTPIVIAAEGDALTINGAHVVVPNLGYAGLVAHIIDGAFLPGQPVK